MLWLLLAWTTLAWPSPGCPEGALGSEALLAALDASDEALGVLDVARFEAAVERALGAVDCLGEPVTPELASRLHRTVGLQAFGRRQPSAEAAFAASRRTALRAGQQPSLPEALFPADSPVSEAWGKLPLAGLPLEVLDPPAQGALLLDGERTLERAIDLPVVLQWLDDEGRIALSRYLPAGTSAASLYPTRPEPKNLEKRPWKERAPLAAAALGSGLAAVGLWGLSLHGQARYLDLEDPVPDERLEGLRARTNALAIASLGCAGASAASGVLLAVRW